MTYGERKIILSFIRDWYQMKSVEYGNKIGEELDARANTVQKALDNLIAVEERVKDEQ